MRRLFALAAMLSLLLLVATGALWALSSDGGVLKNPARPSNFPVQSQLARPLPQVNFNGVAFGDALDFIRDVSGVPLEVDWAALQAAGVDRSTPITVTASNFRLGELLAFMLPPGGGVVYVTRGNGIYLTTRAALDRNPGAGPATVPANRPTARDPRIRELVVGGHRWTATLDPFGTLYVWRNPVDPASAYQPPPTPSPVGNAPVMSHQLGDFSVQRYGYPFHSFAFGVPLWALGIVFALLPLLWLVLRIRRARRKGAGQCPKCGYDLRATPGRCPECGAETETTAAPHAGS